MWGFALCTSFLGSLSMQINKNGGYGFRPQLYLQATSRSSSANMYTEVASNPHRNVSFISFHYFITAFP